MQPQAQASTCNFSYISLPLTYNFWSANISRLWAQTRGVSLKEAQDQCLSKALQARMIISLCLNTGHVEAKSPHESGGGTGGGTTVPRTLGDRECSLPSTVLAVTV